MCFVCISEETEKFALYVINIFVFITEAESVYSAVRTESLYKTDTFDFITKVESVYSTVRTESLYKTDKSYP